MTDEIPPAALAELERLLAKATAAEHGTPRFTADMEMLNWMHAHGAATVAAARARIQELESSRSTVFDSPVYQRTHEAYNRCRQTLGEISEALHFTGADGEHASNCPGCAASKALCDAQEIEAPPRGEPNAAPRRAEGD